MQLQLTLDLDKLQSRLSAAQAADWMAKYLFAQVSAEEQENLQVWAETLGQVVRERVNRAQILAANQRVAMTCAQYAEFKAKLSALGIPETQLAEKPTRQAPAPKPKVVIDLLSEDLR